MEIDTELVFKLPPENVSPIDIQRCCYLSAIEKHDATMTATEILKIREIMHDNPNYFVGEAKNIAQTVNKTIISMAFSKDNGFRDAFFSLKSLPANMNCRHSFSKFENLQFEFIAHYSRIVRRLFSFIEPSNIRNWLQHLSSAKILQRIS